VDEVSACCPRWPSPPADSWVSVQVASLSGILGGKSERWPGPSGDRPLRCWWNKKTLLHTALFFSYFQTGTSIVKPTIFGTRRSQSFPPCLPSVLAACHCSLQMQCPDRCVPTGPASAGRLRLRIRGAREPALFGDATCGVRAGPYKCNLDSSPTTRCGTPLLHLCPRVPASPVPTLRQNASQHSTA